MNNPGIITPKADQPRVTTENLQRGEQAPSLQYKTNSFVPIHPAQKTVVIQAAFPDKELQNEQNSKAR
jgi:hypothetical protein